MEHNEQPLALAAVLTDRYRIERQLGAGSMATVYLAHDLKLDREVALKVLRRDLGAGGSATVYLADDLKRDREVALKGLRQELGAVLGSERFRAEVKITARL